MLWIFWIYHSKLTTQYFPSGLCVIISWVSFLIPPEDVNARIALLITILLVLVTLLNGVIDSSPKAREGETALGTWLVSMLFFVFMAFVCHCAVILERKRHAIKANTTSKLVLQVGPGFSPNTNGNHNGRSRPMERTKSAKTDSSGHITKFNIDLVDFISVGIHIALFVIFIAVYMYVYL